MAKIDLNKKLGITPKPQKPPVVNPQPEERPEPVAAEAKTLTSSGESYTERFARIIKLAQKSMPEYPGGAERSAYILGYLCRDAGE